MECLKDNSWLEFARITNPAMNIPIFLYGSHSYGPYSENHTLYAGKILIWGNLVHNAIF